jgi:hypothetical protein
MLCTGSKVTIHMIYKITLRGLLAAVMAVLMIDTLWADLGAVGQKRDPVVTTIVDIMLQINALQEIQTQINATLLEYDKGTEECTTMPDPRAQAACKKNLLTLLIKAKSLFKKLVAQAQSIEAEIAVGKNRVNDRELKKLDRLLAEIGRIRRITQSEIEARSL